MHRILSPAAFGQDHRSRLGFITAASPTCEEKIPATPEKIQHNSGFLDGFWTLWDDSGAGGVVRDCLSGQDDGCDLFRSCAVLWRLLGGHTSRERSSNRKHFSLPKAHFRKNDTSAPAPGLTAVVGPGMPPEHRARLEKTATTFLSTPTILYDSTLPQDHPTRSRNHPGTRNCAGIFLEGLDFFFAG